MASDTPRAEHHGMDAPRVSVVVPCKNEAAFVGATLTALLEQTLPPAEVLVVDGGSRDGTRDIVTALAARDPRLRLLDNPAGSTPAALNRGIRAARGDVIVRVDCHATYPRDYVERLVHALDASGADMVGGCLETVAARPGAVAGAIALALGSPFGTGSPFRWSRSDGPADAVPFGCWRRALFDRVGLFDERLARNQDNEHSARILARGGRVHRTAAVTVRYHPRATMRGLVAQALDNGRWNAFTERLYPYTFRWRHLAPGVFFAGVAGALLFVVAGIAAGDRALVTAGIGAVTPYALANAFAAVAAAARARRLPLAPLVAFVLWTWHLVYGFGVVYGWALVASGRWRAHLSPAAG